MSEHTPGVWIVMGKYPLLGIVEERENQFGGHYPIVDTYANYLGIGSIYRGLPRSQDECEANARLIAAAPDMEAALEALLEGIKHIDAAYRTDAENQAIAALAKARGEGA